MTRFSCALLARQAGDLRYVHSNGMIGGKVDGRRRIESRRTSLRQPPGCRAQRSRQGRLQVRLRRCRNSGRSGARLAEEQDHLHRVFRNNPVRQFVARRAVELVASKL